MSWASVMPPLNTAFKPVSTGCLTTSCLAGQQSPMHPTATRLYEAAHALKQTDGQSAVARLLNESPQTVKNWESRGVSQKGLIKAEQAIGCSAIWIATGAGEMFGATIANTQPPQKHFMSAIHAWEYFEDLPPGEFVFIPCLNFHLSAGHGLDQMEIEFVQAQAQAFRAEWVRREGLKPAKLACMYAKGNSMEPSIWDGDSLVIDTSQIEIIDGKVYALWYEGGERVKRLYRLPGGSLRIRSDNSSEHPDIVLNKEHLGFVRIIGRVVHRSGKGGL